MRRAQRNAPAFQRAFVRSLIAFFAAFLGFVHVAAISHMAFVAHARCAEHGDLVHVEAAPAAAARPAIEADHPSPQAVPNDAHAAEDHDHCALGLAPPDEGRVARGAPAPVLDADPPAAPLAVLPSQARPASVSPAPPIAILLLSPKSSPPV